MALPWMFTHQNSLAGGGGNSANALGVDFITGSGYLSRAGLSGVANSPYVSVFAWLKPVSDATTRRIFGLTLSSGSYLDVKNNSGGSGLYCEFKGTGGGTRFISTASPLATGWTPVWFNFSVVTGANVAYCYNGGSKWGALSGSNTTGNFLFSAQTFRIGNATLAAPGAAYQWSNSMTEFWMSPTFLDFSVQANREKFVSASGDALYLGANGELPTGSAPAIYLKGPASGWGTNLGTGGDFTQTGTFADAVDNPPQ